MTDSPAELLQSVYAGLGFCEGVLLSATDAPRPEEPSNWVEVGHWLSLAKEVGVERVFFVDNNPVAVFAQRPSQNPDQIRKIVNRIWCMARPQLLFLAMPGELLVYDLARPPERENNTALDRCLATVTAASDVQAKLASFHREQIESGKLFEEQRFESSVSRADHSLVRDLRVVRNQLVAAGLKVHHAHALIGRSIFVRYLEDRRILSASYFEALTESQPKWRKILNSHPKKRDVDPEMDALLYPRVLADKDFTYALFEKLAADFNGDMFPQDSTERNAVEDSHLLALQALLRGDTGPQESLFFFAYRFDVIPIELISSIYEEFYNTAVGVDANQGSHYTPSALVEFLLSRLLTPDILARDPRILDPACGSGIFLVEAFRRIVRFKVTRARRRLNSTELRAILRDQLVGIEINPEATRVAAFSLYLALLHYQNPPDILQQKELPNLLYSPGRAYVASRHFNILLTANAFDVDNVVTDPRTRIRFGTACADIVVGNPPWGYPGPTDARGRQEADHAIAWCLQYERPVGDKELSQAFIHRAIDALRPNGRAGMLVSTGVLLKGHQNSKAFRDLWLDAVTLLHVVNFSHVREVFFATGERASKAIAPFASVVFEVGHKINSNTTFEYWSAKKTAFTALLQVVVLSRADLRILRQSDVRRDDRLWKIYWWGTHRDEALIIGLSMNPHLKDAKYGRKQLVQVDGIGRGFEVLGGPKPVSSEFSKLSELPSAEIHRYGPLDPGKFAAVPKRVYREGNHNVYNGNRIIIRRGISQRGNTMGILVARLESDSFAFRNSVHGVRLGDVPQWIGKVLLGILWSSLARYYFFLTARSWGSWHHEIHKDEVGAFPVRLPRDKANRGKIIAVVDALRAWQGADSAQGQFWSRPPRSASRALQPDPTVKVLEAQLDAAIFELYELTDAERDLVLDMCSTGLELYYQGMRSAALKSIRLGRPSAVEGRLNDLPNTRANEEGLEGYLAAFLTTWNRELGPGGQFRWHVVRPDRYDAMIAVVFSAEFFGESSGSYQAPSWADILRRLQQDSSIPYGTRGIQIEGMYRIVSDSDFVIIKQNERRLWTRSAAREDAEALMLDIVRRQEVRR